VASATIVSTLMVGITILNDQVTFILTHCFQILVTTTSETLGEDKVTWIWRCPILWLPIRILCGAKWGCEYTFGTLLLNWMDGWICRFCGPNWPPNSMPFNQF
jgi:hypothetical protein